MEDHTKVLANWAGVGAALGLGIVLGMSLRTLALGAIIGVGAGAALGAGNEAVLRRRARTPRMLPASAEPALH
ncbi:hypothetical protein [Phenylobacterium sp.]|jgi:hypothetical protein|uniref:hypothetical protein n=1 Tax=Phenylobacterium sp. TaxID=1871053 RepID=UPI002F93A36A